VNADQTEALKRRLSSLDTEDITRMLGPDREQYTRIAQDMAEQELLARGVTEGELVALQNWITEAADQDLAFVETEIAEVKRLDESDKECHVCGSLAPAHSITFGLASVQYGKREFSTSLALLALITLPLVGVAALRTHQEVQARVLQLRLRLCDQCQAKRRRMGRLDLGERDCQHHPGFERSVAIGFDVFVNPFEFR
jgi:hypothetical protein